MAKLIIDAHYAVGKETGDVSASVPFSDGTHHLPDVFPFNKNVYVGPDYGYALNWVSIDVKSRTIKLAFDETVQLDEQGHGKWENRSVQFEFSLED